MNLKQQIKEKFGSVSALARILKVTRSSIYLVLNNDPHMKKLRAEIIKLIGGNNG